MTSQLDFPFVKQQLPGSPARKPVSSELRDAAASPRQAALDANLSGQEGKAGIPAPVLQGYTGLFFGATKKANGETVVADAKTAGAKKPTRAANAKLSAPPERMSFKQFLELAEKDFDKYVPTTKQYFVRNLESWGTHKERILGEEVTVYDAMKKPWIPDTVQDRKAFYGQELIVHEIVQQLKKLDKAPYLIQLVGPNGVGKSQLIELAQEAVRVASKQLGGERYATNIIFADKKNKGVKLLTPGNHPDERGADQLPREADITFKLPSPLHINPFFLLSQQERSDFIRKLKAKGKLDPKKNYDYFISGGALDYRTALLIDALKKHYDGDLNKVFQNHVQVERYDFPQGIVPAAETPHAEIRQLSPEIQWNNAPRVVLNSGALITYNGYLPKTGNGSINFDDMGRSARTDFSYLIQTARTGELVLNSAPGHPMMSVKEPVDIIFFSTANPDGLHKISEGGNFRAMMDRTIYIVVPYERRYKSEMRIHQALLDQAAAGGRKVAPHVAEAYALWATMTRLLPVDINHKEYSASLHSDVAELKKGLSKLDILKKALLYQEDDNINSFQSDPSSANFITPIQYETLKRNLKEIAREHSKSTGQTNFSEYEGAFGISPSDGYQKVVPDIINLNADTGHPLTVLDVFEHVAEMLKRNPVWITERNAFLQTYQKSHPSLPKLPSELDLLKQVEDHSRRQFLMEVRQALQVYQPVNVHAKILDKYLEHIRALTATKPSEREVKPEYRDNVNNKEPDMKFVEDMEKAMMTPAGQTSLRSLLNTERMKILAKMNRWDEHKSRLENIKRLYTTELSRMHAYDEKSSEAKFKSFLQDTIWRQTNPARLERESKSDPKRKLEIDRMEHAIQVLSKQGYPPESLPKLLGWAFGKGYISDKSLEVYAT